MKAHIHSKTQGVTFSMRLVQPGDLYGLNNVLRHDENKPSMVEFYDTRYDFDRDPAGEILGQFVTRYYVDTFLQGTGGITLDGGVRVWALDHAAGNCARAVLRNWIS